MTKFFKIFNSKELIELIPVNSVKAISDNGDSTIRIVTGWSEDENYSNGIDIQDTTLKDIAEFLVSSELYMNVTAENEETTND